MVKTRVGGMYYRTPHVDKKTIHRFFNELLTQTRERSFLNLGSTPRLSF